MIYMKGLTKILITVSILILTIIIFYVITSNITKYTGFLISEDIYNNEKKFVNCIEKKNIIVFVDSDDLSNFYLIKYLDKFELINCKINDKLCLEKEINFFPSFIIEEEKIEENINFNTLSDITGCSLK